MTGPLFRSRRWLALGVVCLGVLMVVLDLLSGSNAPLARIVEDVGYQTDTAFSRAFRREYGTPPAAWRRRQAARAAPGSVGPCDQGALMRVTPPRVST